MTITKHDVATGNEKGRGKMTHIRETCLAKISHTVSSGWKNIFKIPILRYTFVALLGIVIIFLYVNIHMVYPSFTRLIIKNTEQEATRVGEFLKGEALDEDGKFTSAQNLKSKAEHLLKDFKLMKLKIFEPSGRIVYSSDNRDIGKLNDKSYFHEIVAKGQVYTKVVEKDSYSAEDQKVTMDVVETYVPVMDNGVFKGAFEIYYDITERQAKLDKAWVYASAASTLVMGIFLTTIGISLSKVGKNITQRKQAENELIKAREELEIRVKERTAELAAANRSLTQTMNTLEQKNCDLREFVHVASHDLREPLRKITAFTALLKDSLEGTLGDDDSENFEFVIEGANRIAEMVKSLSQYSQLINHQRPFAKVDLERIVRYLQGSEFAALLEETGGVVEISGPLPEVRADSVQIGQVLQNLIANGIKYRQEGIPPRIVIEAEQIDPGKVKIEVRDNGIGIKPQHFCKIFTLFHRLHSRDKNSSAGISLAICKKVIERHDGDIGVRSTYGEGSTFWFTLPAWQAPDPEVGNSATSIPSLHESRN